MRVRAQAAFTVYLMKAGEDMMMPTMTPKRPRADPKICTRGRGIQNRLVLLCPMLCAARVVRLVCSWGLGWVGRGAKPR
jgi:hypothetical protein